MNGPVTLIAAYARDRVIGNGPDIPWHSREDFAHFKKTTLGHTLVLGRVTHESIGHPLPGRRTIVVTRDRGWAANGVDVAHSVVDALTFAAARRDAGGGGVFVAGGAQIYAAAMPYATHQILTEMHLDVPGDAFYPDFDDTGWGETRSVHRPDLEPPLTWRWLRRSTSAER